MSEISEITRLREQRHELVQQIVRAYEAYQGGPVNSGT